MINLISAVGIAVIVSTWVVFLTLLFKASNRCRISALLYELNPDEPILFNGKRAFFYRHTCLGEYKFLTYYTSNDSEYHSINVQYIKSIRRIHA